MNDRLILAGFLASFVLAAFVISFLIERHALDPDYRKDWWSVAFIDPKGDALDFTIENHGNATHFSYTVTRSQETLSEGTTDLSGGTSVTVPVTQTATDDRTTVTVRTGDTDMKEIYK